MRGILAFIKIALLVNLLIFTKNAVKDLNDTLSNINSTIEKEKNKLISLNAELSYLSKPGRIEVLSKKYLNLVYPTVDQIDVLNQ
ncbi:putative septum formation protein [Candidatus Cyrtobacter comes]|uniref:Septum formation protein n=1 Tax=Candidatus Cyrtobacter comes TaxID=675776 RepID=A0ABU5L7C3_9RICK|nr:hypothetical protein [Candidatus Cyrtobacter comes]MDZ5762032.1 putative septum formation protein [Candidatus Cyrtobacter comes]